MNCSDDDMAAKVIAKRLGVASDDVIGDGLYARLCKLFDERSIKTHKTPGAFTHQLALVAAEFTRQEIIGLGFAAKVKVDAEVDRVVQKRGLDPSASSGANLWTCDLGHDRLSTIPKSKGRSPMTTIVGIACEDGLVIASDSKATKGSSAREEFLKIWDLDVRVFPAVITGAGRSAFIAKYRQFLQAECDMRSNRQPIQSLTEFVDIAEETMQHLSRRYGTERLTRLGLMRAGGDDDYGDTVGLFLPPFQAVIGLYDNGPHFFFVGPDGVSEEQQLFGATGSGGPYCEYLLQKMICDGMSVAEGALFAVHIVEQVKHVDPHSGGSTQLAIVTKDGVKHWTTHQVNAATLAVSDIDEKTSTLWRSSVRSQVNGKKGAKKAAKKQRRG